MSACFSLMGIALFKCLAADPACLPQRYDTPKRRIDLAALAEQESGFRPWALRDEAAQESLFMLSRDTLKAEIKARLDKGHKLGVGLFQITGEDNWLRHGLTTYEKLTDPCANMAAAAEHYEDDITAAADQRYNSGRTNGAPAYAASMAQRRLRLANILLAPPPDTQSAPQMPLPRATAFSRVPAHSTAFSRPLSRPADAQTAQRLADRK